MSRTGNVVFVDTYAPTRRLAPYFRDAGCECVRVQSTVEVPSVYRSAFSLDDYTANIVHRGSLTDTVREVAKYDPIAVVAGGEMGVELADALSEALGLPTNGTALSAARRDKYIMIETIRAAGLRAARQIRIGSAEELRSWHEEIGGRIVLKPERSAASDGIHFCSSADEAVGAYHELLGRTNVFAEPNRSVVAQEYLVGTEYIVNTVSRAGRHHVCDIWQTVRVNVNGNLDSMAAFYIIPRAGAIQEQLVSYGCEVLDAVGIEYGPAHIEIKMTPDGPCLVEVGARLAGSDNPYYTEQVTGESQLNWTVDAYLDPERFDRRYQEPYVVHEHFAWVAMLSPCKGVLQSYPFLSAVERMESVHDIKITVQPGDPITPSIDDSTVPVVVNLRHPVEGVLMRDMATLRYLDGPAFYEVV